MDEDTSNNSIASLPQELIEAILSNSLLSSGDLSRFSCVCSRFRDVALSNNLWKIKFQQRWPELSTHYFTTISYDWKKEFKYKLLCDSKILSLLDMMSSMYYTNNEVSQEAFSDLKSIMEEHSLGYYIVLDVLLTTLKKGSKEQNLTIKYYTEKAVRFVKHFHLKIKWEEILQAEDDCLVLETGAVLLAQWCQPLADIEASVISSQLDEIVRLVKLEITKRCPTHPVLKADFSPSSTVATESIWAPKECHMILGCLNTVLFEQLDYSGNQERYYDAENSFIDKILEKRTGIPISLCIIYSSIAQRLGIVCEPVNYPSHFLLRWKEHPSLTNGQEFTYIDVFNRGRFISEVECATLLSNLFTVGPYDAVPALKVFQRMAHNLVEVGRQQNNTSDCLLCLRNALELLLLLQPEDTDSRLLLARVYLHLNINFPEVMSSLKQIQASDPTRAGIVAYMFQLCQQKMNAMTDVSDKQIHPKLRSENAEVEFAVGMIMVHKKYHYMCVIYGWDPQCTADNDWIIQMGVHNLSKKQFQPFYHVLVEDGSNRYAAQENLMMAPNPSHMNHAEIGRYFSDFSEMQYVPNEEKAREYPEDEVFRRLLIINHYAITV